MVAVSVHSAGAYGAVTVILLRLTDLLRKKWIMLVKADRNLKSLAITLKRIRLVLEDGQRWRIMDKSTSEWLVELQVIFYDIDDIVDDYLAITIRRSMFCKPWIYILDIGPVSNLAKKVVDVRARLDAIIKDKEIKLQEPQLSEQADIAGETSSLLTHLHRPIIGRDADKDNIINMIFRLSNGETSGHQTIPVISIVGLSGVGKTFLAQLVINNERFTTHFDIKIWVSASRGFDVKRTTKEIIESIMGTASADISNLNALQSTLAGLLRGKMFLLVLDDLTNVDPVEWECFCGSLAGSIGSLIMVTTQNTKVSDVTSMVEPYVLRGLSNDDEWSLLKSWSRCDENYELSPIMEAIGLEIAKKLSGMPYGARALSQFLKAKPAEQEWRKVLEAETWEMDLGPADPLLALKSSFDRLPIQIKRCFQYCSLFPPGHKFNEDKLIQMWIAHDLLQPVGFRGIKDTGLDYLEELVCRFFLIRVERHYVMNKPIYDLAKSVYTVRHLWWCGTTLNRENLKTFGNLRTLLFSSCKFSFNVLRRMFKMLKSVRVLDLSKCSLKRLPNTIGYLSHLRYLDLSNNRFRKLPFSITKLYHLQTLILENCPNSRQMIAGIYRIGIMVSLQKLDIYKVQRRYGFKISELKFMNRLQGNLSIQDLQNVRTLKEAREAKLDQKKDLHALELHWGVKTPKNTLYYNHVLEILKPQQNLKELYVSFYPGTLSPSWIKNQYLSCIKVLVLQYCKNWNQLPTLGSLRFLKYLRISGMDSIQLITKDIFGDGEICGFPSLEYLVIMDMPNLEEWEQPDQHMPCFSCLRKLSVKNCPNLKRLPISLLARNLEHIDIVECTILSRWVHGGYISGNNEREESESLSDYNEAEESLPSNNEAEDDPSANNETEESPSSNNETEDYLSADDEFEEGQNL